MIILAIETSCDDTSVCILRSPSAGEDFPQVQALNFFSQEMILARWGGVIPEIAARNHLAKLAPLLEQCLSDSKVDPAHIDQIAVTTHPGLLGPLLTGLNAAKALALLFQKPINPVNHLYAHLQAVHLTEKVPYPYLGLLASGGHCLYMLVTSPTDFKILGRTVDDAAGEAFDKGGKLLGLGYPAGAKIDQHAARGKRTIAFPIGLKDSHDAMLSFSGVKTALRLYLEEHHLPAPGPAFDDLCCSYQEAITDALVLKLAAAAQNYPQLPIVVGGGVASNSNLRQKVAAWGQEHQHPTFFVAPRYCTDNSAMVANYAWQTPQNAVAYPACLGLEAAGRFIEKGVGGIHAK
jgi:N6-L-threonylcarbamoyladenine synthase